MAKGPALGVLTRATEEYQQSEGRQRRRDAAAKRSDRAQGKWYTIVALTADQTIKDTGLGRLLQSISQKIAKLNTTGTTIQKSNFLTYYKKWVFFLEQR